MAKAKFDVRLGRAGRRPIQLDLRHVVKSRLLVAANSGAGKSWMMRLIAEQACGVLPTIVLDSEGEFVSLREMHDVVLVSHDGDVVPTVRTAPLIARQLIELGVSAVVDLYELEPDARRAFVRGFLTAMLEVPRELWAPRLVMLDEVQEFCPERGAGAGTPEARRAVIRLLAQGRKRGLGAVIATQRLAQLSKDAAAHAVNVLVGRTTLDVDIARSRGILGFAAKDAATNLRGLKPGDWYCTGQGFSVDAVTRFRSDAVKTTHPEAGEGHLLQAPPPSRKLRKKLAELAALTGEEEGQVYSLEDAQAEIDRLRAELVTARGKGEGRTVKARPAAPSKHAIDAAVAKAEARLRANFERERGEQNKAVEAALSKLGRVQGELRALLPAGERPNSPARAKKPAAAAAPRVGRGPSSTNGVSLGGGKQRLMVVLAQHPEGCERPKLALLARMSVKSGTLSTYLSELRTSGYAESDGGVFSITDAGLEAVGEYPPLPEGRDLLAYWLNWCGNGGKRRILEALVDAGEGGMTRREAAAAAGMAESSGTLSTYLSELRRAGLVASRGKARLAAAATLIVAAEH